MFDWRLFSGPACLNDPQPWHPPPISLPLRDRVTRAGLRVIHLNADRHQDGTFSFTCPSGALRSVGLDQIFNPHSSSQLFCEERKYNYQSSLLLWLKVKAWEHLLRGTTESFVSIIHFFSQPLSGGAFDVCCCLMFPKMASYVFQTAGKMKRDGPGWTQVFW